ncbi:MAG TPA: hypothetical protein VGN12_13345 [Pirellulales bacterium]|jgi:beta-RFAP synthase
MPRRVVQVTTGCRLHFGMLSFGQRGVREFGGAGAMIDAAGVALRISPSTQLKTSGPLAEVALRHAQSIADAPWFGRTPDCEIQIMSVPPPHAGLGSGTQLALAVAAGMARFFDCPTPDLIQLVQAVGRGRRSAVGLYGFWHGGLIVEAGKRSEEEISPLLHRIALPEDWRFLLIRSAESEGLSGENERQAFGRLPPVPVEVTARMCQELLLEMIPAAIEGDYSAFSSALFRFGEDAGRCFAAQQGGVYGSAQMTWAVDELRKLGVAGVAQSSWGPTVFAVLPNQRAAEEIQAHFDQSQPRRPLSCIIARPRNEPARVDVILE